MPRALPFPHIAADQRGPLLIGAGLTVVLAAQLFSEIPLAAAMALIGSGATLTLATEHRHALLLPLNLCVYVSLAALAVAAQFHARLNAWTIADAMLAATLIALTMRDILFPSRNAK